MVLGGVAFLGFSLFGGMEPGMEMVPGVEEPRMEEMEPGMESM